MLVCIITSCFPIGILRHPGAPRRQVGRVQFSRRAGFDDPEGDSWQPEEESLPDMFMDGPPVELPCLEEGPPM